jgi:5-methylcytosine-specific restriction endonuclease McrA
MSNFVFVIDADKKPLDPCNPARARILLSKGKAAVFRRFPFTIILKYPVKAAAVQEYQIKLDPGSKTSGIAIVRNGRDVIWAANLNHRGWQIRKRIDDRRAFRRSRRNRKTRYRKARFMNRTKPKGWLPPSLNHRVRTILTWVSRFVRMIPISGFVQELVRFDTQKLNNPEISGIEYQQGELFGYEIREYLLEKWGRKCAYCGKQGIPLEVEHIIPKSKGGSDRVGNLTLSCTKCNLKKGNKPVEQFLSKKPELLKKIKAKASNPLKDAAVINATRWKLFNTLKEFGLPVEAGTGGSTKCNRIKFGFKKDHWIDAACTGKTENLHLYTNKPLIITAKGHGSRQMVRMDKYGFPASGPKQKIPDWKTGDFVTVVKGKNAGLHGIRLKTVRFKGNFDIRLNGKILSVSRNHIRKSFSADGYDYQF